MATIPAGSYRGGVPSYGGLTIGCDANNSCMAGRIDELRISNIQRTFDWTIDPTTTPTPTPTPGTISEYSVDANTLALYHLNSQTQWNQIFDEVSGVRPMGSNTGIVPEGRYHSALAVNPTSALTSMGGLGNPSSGTVEGWIKLSSVPGSFTVIGTKGYWNSPSENVLLGMSSRYGSTLRFGILTGSVWVWADSGINASAFVGTWHHVAGTWGPRGLEVWIDGQLCRTAGYFANIPGSVDSYFFGCGPSGNCIQGTVDEVRVSNIQRMFSQQLILGPLRTAQAVIRQGADVGFQAFLPFVELAPTPTPIPYIQCAP
jgi:hypothetical protein